MMNFLRIAVLVVGTTDFTVVIQLNKPPYSGSSYNPFPDYDDERTVFAKALKVLVDIEETNKFHDFLVSNNIQTIMVTTALTPSQVNARNKWSSDTIGSKQTIQGLLDIKRRDPSQFQRTFKFMT